MRFKLESPQGAAAGDAPLHDLDGHLAARTLLHGLVDDAHAAFAARASVVALAAGAVAIFARVAHVAGAEISQKPLSLSVPESGLYISAGLYLLGNGQLSTRR